MEKTIIGVLALQGAFIEHEQMLRTIGAETFQIRQLSDLKKPKDGIIIPGGESTAQLKLLRELGLLDPLREEIKQGMPVFGTCAGLILLAKNVEGETTPRIATMDIEARRNAYGRQLGSFTTKGHVENIGTDVPMTFIRAPYIHQIESPRCQPLATIEGRIVAARQGAQLATAFHPELGTDTRIHRYFLKIVEETRRNKAQDNQR